MKKKLLVSIFVALSILSGTTARAQYLDPHYAIYLPNPLGLFSKADIKVEYRLNLQNALLLSYTQYWGFFPGYQGALEYRMYFTDRSRRSSSENFIYGKAGLGFADYASDNGYPKISIFGDGRTNYNAPGTYVFGGGGVGRHFNFDWFFLDLNAGLKFAELTTPPAVYNEHLFYLTGPGSYVDINFHFGIQF
jgi:hypothetical protein